MDNYLAWWNWQTVDLREYPEELVKEVKAEYRGTLDELKRERELKFIAASKQRDFYLHMHWMECRVASADPNAVDDDGRTALMHVAMRKPEAQDDAFTLLEIPVNFRLKDKQGKTALDYAIACGINKVAYEILRTARYQFNVNRRNDAGFVNYWNVKWEKGAVSVAA